MAISRLFTNFRKTLLLNENSRGIALSAARNLKEIRETKEGNTTIIEGVIVPQPKLHLFLKPSENGACSLCSTGVDLKHTDILILSQFVRKDGCMLPRRVTGLCKVQQKRVGIMVAMAHKAGLMGHLKPEKCKMDPKKRYQFKKYNTYFDEDTIKHKYY